MSEERDLDHISELFRRESAALRKRTLWLSLVPIVVGAAVIVTAYLGVRDARARLAETQALRAELLAELEELEATRDQLAEEVEQQKAVVDHFKEKLPPEEQAAANLVQSGLEAYNKGEYERAVETLQSAAAANEDLAEVHYRLGIALWRTGKSKAALEQVQTAFKLDKSYEERARQDPRFKPIWDYSEFVEGEKSAVGQGEAKHIEDALLSAKSGSFDRAIDSYRKALEVNPENAKVHGWEGYALYKQGRYEEAIESYAHCLEIDPESAECHYNMGLALWQTEERERATAEFDRAFELDPRWEGRARQDPAYRRILKEIEARQSARSGPPRKIRG